jgi:ankyrin repeat protein
MNLKMIQQKAKYKNEYVRRNTLSQFFEIFKKDNLIGPRDNLQNDFLYELPNCHTRNNKITKYLLTIYQVSKNLTNSLIIAGLMNL